ncbi:SDR family oxidoreductase [Hoyosella rhizosphaerae]|uniref:3-alpha-hydroxysteroid dehydrogenase n=1 Tax=Hoyosella rhizosphaerae TaxID=1755582 RepID=A0A916UBA0_9ACTN|nr:SDR family NAD(P)-dependent oxidoreductase [Hoyosella rhizosphaerae]MBN4926053.1 SDR family oxidoreductase [Hoyosella rhizosphaerae]GGC65915.1 3-alpha-hydroxysteroid dehydrogenase [Hoyosella rhizosphaerae]
MSDLAQVAIVTGGARGIGEAVVRRFHHLGMHVVVADVLDNEGQQLAAELGTKATFCHLDVRKSEQWAEVVEVSSALGQLSVLVNNAGVLRFGSIEEQDPDEFRFVLDVNLTGAWLGMRACGASLRAVGGVIVNVSSTAGLAGYSHIGAYVASKWALRGITKTAALEFADSGVRVCSVHPGPIRTPMTADFDDSLVVNQPIARFGEPDEVADMVEFVVMKATFTTGAEFVIDGGALTGQALAVPTSAN